jgi:hypothetical protein
MLTSTNVSDDEDEARIATLVSRLMSYTATQRLPSGFMVFDRSSTRTLISLLQQLSEHLIFWRRLNKLSIQFL